MQMKREFWRSRTVTVEEAENGAPVSLEAKRPRHRLRVILVLALSGALGGFLVSYLFPPRYTSQSTILVQGQKIPSNYVAPIITSDFTQRIATLQQEILSTSHLRPVVQSLGLVKPDVEGELMEDIRSNMTVTPVITSISEAASTTGGPETKPASPTDELLPGFNISYSDNSPARAQKICNALSSLMMDENLRSRAEVAKSTTDFLERQVDETRGSLVEMETQLAVLSRDQSPRSPDVEAKRKVLALDRDVAEKDYTDLQVKLRQARLAMVMENEQLGEQMTLLMSAGLPLDPDFPNRPQCALWGMGVGVLLGLGRALWPTQKARTEALAGTLQDGSPIPPA